MTSFKVYLYPIFFASVAITYANININQMATTLPSVINKLAITPAKTKYKLQIQKGNMAITSANNIKVPKIIGNITCQRKNKKNNESIKLQGSPTL